MDLNLFVEIKKIFLNTVAVALLYVNYIADDL